MAEITNFEKVLWGLSFFLKGVLVAQLLFRKNQRIYPYFFAYAVLTFLHSPVLFLSYRIWGFNSGSVVDLAWGTQGLVIAARALAVAEIWRRVVGRYRGVWGLAWRMLLAIAGL